MEVVKLIRIKRESEVHKYKITSSSLKWNSNIIGLSSEMNYDKSGRNRGNSDPIYISLALAANSFTNGGRPRVRCPNYARLGVINNR